MAYVTPNSWVQYYGDIGLSPDYSNCVYFASNTAKDNTFGNLSAYIREERNVTYVKGNKFRSALPMNVLYRARYMRFRNTSFENKWFYAFITNVEYANNGMVEITYEIDYITTWMGVFSLGQCFVERQHTVNDGIGDNIASEGLATGNYVSNYVPTRANVITDYVYVVFSTDSEKLQNKLQPVYRHFMYGTYTGICYAICQDNETGRTLLRNFIDDAEKEPDKFGVVSIQMLPTSLLVNGLPAFDSPSTFVVNTPKPAIGDDFGGYVPKNNKLYVYPYTFLEVYNTEGGISKFRYENFTVNNIPTTMCEFKVQGILGMNSEILLKPLYYCNGGANTNEYGTSMKHFVECPWFTDSYQAYMAQTKSQLPVTLLGTALNIASDQAMVGMRTYKDTLSESLAEDRSSLKGLSQISNTALNILSGSIEAKNTPNQLNGNQVVDLTISAREKDFYFSRKRITKNYAIMIDDYFTAFGYAVRQVMTPNMNARPHFTYVKTIDCQINGSLPSKDASIIQNIFNNGVRFWNNISEIGNYSLDNSPTT